MDIYMLISRGSFTICYKRIGVCSNVLIECILIFVCRTNCLTDMVCWSLRQAYPLEVGLLQIPAYCATLSIFGHGGIHVDLLVWSELERSLPVATNESS